MDFVDMIATGIMVTILIILGCFCAASVAVVKILWTVAFGGC